MKHIVTNGRNAARHVRALSRRFGKDQAGATAVIAAILFPVIIGGLGLGVETGYWYLMQRKLQHAADVSAHAGAIRHRAGADVSGITAAAIFIARESGHPADAPTPGVTIPYEGDADAVEVKLEQPVPRMFTSLFVDEPLVLTARAVARVDGVSTPACVLALSPDAAGAVTAAGSATVELTGCDLVSNSSAANALDMRGAVTVTAGCAYAVGGAQGTEFLTLTGCDGVQKLPAPAADPYGNLPVPDASDCGTQWEAMTVKCYGSGLALTQSILDANPNTLFVITGGQLSAKDSVLQASNVAFHLAGSARLSFEGNSQLDLSAPTTGAYGGILFTGRQDSGVTNTIRGTVNSVLQGAIHFPDAAVEYSGNSSTGCTMIIAYTVTFTGNSGVSCSSPPDTEASQSSRTVSIVE